MVVTLKDVITTLPNSVLIKNQCCPIEYAREQTLDNGYAYNMSLLLPSSKWIKIIATLHESQVSNVLFDILTSFAF